MNKDNLLSIAKYGVIGLAVIIVIAFLRNKLFHVNTIPKELQITYLPAEFKPNIDEEEAFMILSNPYRYANEFEDLVKSINLALLSHVANRMNLDEAQRIEIAGEYSKHHQYLKDLYFEDFVNLQKNKNEVQDQWYANETKYMVEALNEVSSKYTCFLVSHVISTILEMPEGKLLVKGKNVQTPCGLALTEGLRPMIQRLEDQAAINDFSRSRSMLMEKSEQYISELATVKITERKGINKQLFTKIFGFNISSTEIEITALSIMKVGFDLERKFNIEIDAAKKEIIVQLPEPSILSHEVSPRVDKLDIGIIKGLDNTDLNENIGKLRNAFTESSYTEDVKLMAKEKATETLGNFISPILSTLPSGFKIVLEFDTAMSRNMTSETLDF
jgi:hypothetical protein